MTAKKKIILISSISLGVILALLTGLCVYGAIQFQKSDKILSNVTYEGVYIGSLTKEDATALLMGRDFNTAKPIKVTYGEKSFEFAPDGAGISYDYEKIVEDAFAIGREKGISDLIKSRFSYIPAEKIYKEDKKVFNDTIDTLMMANGIDLYNYDIKVYENSASVRISDDLKIVDYEKLYNDTMSVIDKEERNITLNTVRPEKVTAGDIYERIFVKPQNASQEVIDGKTIVTPHTIGVLCNIEDIEKALSEGKTNFTIPVTKKYPEVRVENLSGGLFKDVLGSRTTHYNSGIIGRTKNVTTAAQRINGIILNPGDVFSYNGTVGPRTAAAGFSIATVYTKDGLVEELGGGICQVSSTLYNAVLYADLKVVERRNHTYTVTYVKNGLDATVAYGFIDFKFQNNLSSPIKIVTSVGGGVLTVTLLGIKENNNTVELYTNTVATYPYTEKRVEVSSLAPGQERVKQNGSNGYKINATKVVKDANGNIIRQDFLGTNVYNPLTKIIEVGPAVAAEEPKTDIPLEETSSEIPNGENAEEVNPPQSGNQDGSQETVKPETPLQGEQNSDMEGGEQPEAPSDNGENIGESNNSSDEKTEEANVSSESTTDTE